MHSMNIVLKKLGFAAAFLAMIVALTFVVLTIVGWREVVRTHDITPRISSVPVGDELTIAYGRHLSQILGCVECHGERLEGKVMVDEPPLLAVPTNLTPGKGGIGGDYSAADWDRAIRFGVKPDGRRILAVMPSDKYHAVCDRDMVALITYLESLEPVDNELPESKVRFLGNLIMAISGGGLLATVEGARPTLPDRDPAPTRRYGAYLGYVVCSSCHGDDMFGGENPDPKGPPGSNLAVVAAWSLEGFKTVLREGLTPDGRQLDPQWMPVNSTRHFNDMEIEALYKYLTSLTISQ
jgi:mono/diheme cytochrome c family protein